MWLPDSVLSDVRALEARVFYLSYSACRRWAEHRGEGEPLVFSGWYWSLGRREAGPFKSKSACYRDCWYQLGRRRAPLLTQHNDDFEREQARQAAAAPRRRKPRLRVVA